MKRSENKKVVSVRVGQDRRKHKKEASRQPKPEPKSPLSSKSKRSESDVLDSELSGTSGSGFVFLDYVFSYLDYLSLKLLSSSLSISFFLSRDLSIT